MIATLACLAVAQIGSAPVVWTGGMSKVETRETRLVTSSADWAEVWSRNVGESSVPRGHRGSGEEQPGFDVPQVDFTVYQVLAMFGGKTGRFAGYQVMPLVREGEDLVVRYVPRYFSTVVSAWRKEDVERLQKQFDRTAYAFILIPRQYAKLRIEEGIIGEGKQVTGYKLVKEFTNPAK